jgi:hypothetical protein
VHDDLAPLVLRQLRDPEDLDREDREHAGHQVQDQSTEERQQHRLPERDRLPRARELGRLEPRVLEQRDLGARRGARQRKVDLDVAHVSAGAHREDARQPRLGAGVVASRLALERDQEAGLGERMGAAARDPELDRPGSVGNEGEPGVSRAECQGCIAGRCGDDGDRGPERIARSNRALRVDGVELDTENLGRDGHASRVAFEDLALRAVGRSQRIADAKRARELDLARDALHLADQEVRRHAQLALALHPRLEADLVREQHLVRVAVGGEQTVLLREHLRRGPADRSDRGVVDLPVEARRQTRLAGIPPVDVPAPVQVEEDADGERLARLHLGGVD